MVVLHFHLARVGAGCATFSVPVSFSFMPYSLFSYPQIILKSRIEVRPQNIMKDSTKSLIEMKKIVLNSRPSPDSLSWDFSSSPVQVRYINFRGQDSKGRWTFEDENGIYRLNNKEIEQYVAEVSGGGGGNFIITHKKSGDYDDWEKREHNTGSFARKLLQAGAFTALITSNQKLASEKMNKKLPTVNRNLDVLIERSLQRSENEIKEVLKEYKEIGNLVEIDNFYSTEKENLVVVVAPFSPQLLDTIKKKSEDGLFKDKVVALLVCGQKSNPENHKNYLMAIDTMNKEGALRVISFENIIEYEEAAKFLKELKNVIKDKENKGLNLIDIIEKTIEKTGIKKFKNIRHDVKRKKRFDFFGSLDIQYKKVA